MSKKSKTTSNGRDDTENPKSDYWKKKACLLWYEYIHRKFHDRCAMQGIGTCDGPLEAHHIVTKSVRSLRNDSHNGILLCNYHHQHHAMAPHKSNSAFLMWLAQTHPILHEAIDRRWRISGFDYRADALLLQTKLQELPE